MSVGNGGLRSRADQIEADVLAFIERKATLSPGFHRAAGGAMARGAPFNRLALAVFAYQFEANRPYRAYCQARGVTPDTVGKWRDIPAVPTSAFKELPLCCFPPAEAAVVYQTSGTTRGTEKRGRHYLRSLDLYDASLRPNFLAHVLPDLAGRTIRMLVMFPRPDQMPNSSLGHMLARAVEEWGARGSDWFIGANGLRGPDLLAALDAAERTGEPVALLGTAFSFVHLLDLLAGEGRRVQLPAGSRIMDTGGYKGRSREVPKADLYRSYGTELGVPADHVVNEYGMTELGSQFYDNVLADRVRPGGARAGASRGAGASRAAGGASAAGDPLAGRHKVVVPWVRTVVADPDTLQDLPPGEVGVLRHYDLANVHSVIAVQTDDLGRQVGDGFEILGRVPGSEARGCSIAVDELLTAARRAQV